MHSTRPTHLAFDCLEEMRYLDHFNSFVLTFQQKQEIVRQIFDVMNTDFKVFVNELYSRFDTKLIFSFNLLPDQINTLRDFVMELGLAFYTKLHNLGLFKLNSIDNQQTNFPYFLEHITLTQCYLSNEENLSKENLV